MCSRLVSNQNGMQIQLYKLSGDKYMYISKLKTIIIITIHVYIHFHPSMYTLCSKMIIHVLYRCLWEYFLEIFIFVKQNKNIALIIIKRDMVIIIILDLCTLFIAQNRLFFIMYPIHVVYNIPDRMFLKTYIVGKFAYMNFI